MTENSDDIIKIDQLVKLVSEDDSVIKRQVFRDSNGKAINQVDEQNILKAFEVIGKSIEPRFVIDDDNRKCYVNMGRWLLHDPSMRCINPQTKEPMAGRFHNTGLYIYGNTGTGKTLALEILDKLSRSMNIRTDVGGVKKILSWTTVRADELVDSYIHGSSLSNYDNVTFLCINDLGSEPTDAVYMGTRLNVLRNIIERRGERRDLMTLFTSNLPLGSAELAKLYGDRAVSRLMEMCNFLALRGKDRRLNY